MTHAIHIIARLVVARLVVARLVVARLGGTRAAARLRDRPSSTVQSWKGAGVIPARYPGPILQKAREADIAMPPAELIDPAFLSRPAASCALIATTSSVRSL